MVCLNFPGNFYALLDLKEQEGRDVGGNEGFRFQETQDLRLVRKSDVYRRGLNG